MANMVDELKFGRRLSDIKRDEESKFFHLKYDKECENVIFLLRSRDDVIVFPVHTIQNSGKVRRILCTGDNCPYCKKGEKARDIIFVPIYNVSKDAVMFWERGFRFFAYKIEPMFKTFDDPTRYVFRVTRNGNMGDITTTYEVGAVARNTVFSYEEILQKFDIQFPEFYKTIIEGLDFTEEPEPEPITEEAAYTALICKGCGAPINRADKCCHFCGTSYIWKE